MQASLNLFDARNVRHAVFKLVVHCTTAYHGLLEPRDSPRELTIDPRDHEPKAVHNRRNAMGPLNRTRINTYDPETKRIPPIVPCGHRVMTIATKALLGPVPVEQPVRTPTRNLSALRPNPILKENSIALNREVIHTLVTQQASRSFASSAVIWSCLFHQC